MDNANNNPATDDGDGSVNSIKEGKTVKKMTKDGKHPRCQAPTKQKRQCKNPATKLGDRVCGQEAHIEWGKENLIPTEDLKILRKYWRTTTKANADKLARLMLMSPRQEKVNMWVNIAKNPSYVDEVLDAFRKHWNEVNNFMKKHPSNIDKEIKKDSELYDWLVEMSYQFSFSAPTGRTVGEVLTALTEGGKAVHNFGATQGMLERAEKKANQQRFLDDDEEKRNMAALRKDGLTRCDDCSDSGHCKQHRDDTKIFCDRCSGTGLFIVGFENRKPKVGGSCNRCAGKGGHTNADARRNWGYDQNNI